MKPAAHEIFGIVKRRGFWLRCFLGLCATIAFLASPLASWSQFLGFPCNGNKAECVEKFDQFCRTAENRAPNLFVPKRTRISGVLIDSSGAVFAHPEKGLTVELHDLKTSGLIASSQVSEMGTFDFGTVEPGSYRLIVVLIDQGKRARYRGWQQPGKLACPDSDECTLAALLRPGSTDNPIDFCPPE
ncbi:MAG: carboxypeptidase-like regulatory domain-containing protein [Terracidiphilus sp.]|nr:carboxypeptidase-like regulatory domain-containing protein [Terracidiphilus sp.]